MSKRLFGGIALEEAGSILRREVVSRKALEIIGDLITEVSEFADLQNQYTELRQLREDKRRLDFLQGQTNSDSDSGWIARQSTVGQGYRLIESREGRTKNVREAIDVARSLSGEEGIQRSAESWPSRNAAVRPSGR